MPKPLEPIRDKIYEYLTAHGLTAESGSKNSIGYRELAKRLGARQWEIRKALREIRSKPSDVVPVPEQTESHDIHGDSWVVTLPKTRISTLGELLAYCKIDLITWEVERFLVNKWEVGAKDAAKKIQVEPLFQVKAWLKKKRHTVTAVSEIAALKEEAKQSAPVYAPLIRPVSQTGNMLELAIVDHHFARLSWAPETGYEDYDVKIAEQLQDDAIDGLVARTSGYKFDRVLLPIGNDLFNVDNREATTAAGTKQDVDSRYEKTFKIVRAATVRMVQRLRSIAPVDVILVRGNHDLLSVWQLGDSLECWFHNCPDVNVDNEPKIRKYYQWNRVMLMFTHGKEGKRSDYPLLMATEQPRMFADAFWREAHTAHLHQTRLEEQHGVRVRILPSLAPPSAWEASCGYVGNIRSSEAYVWNREQGLIGTAVYSVPAVAK